MQNYAYIRQLVQEFMKWYFQAPVGHFFCLLFINQGLTNGVCKYANLFVSLHQKFLKPTHICILFSPLHIALCQLSALGFPCIFFRKHHNILLYGMFFMIEIEKSLMLLCIRLGMTVIPLRGGFRILPTYKI